MSATLTKDERYGICRLARRARGLYRAEKQALAFIAEAQTMQNGVCSKALKNGEDFGYSKRNLQWGIHGKHRKGKLEYPGLLARGIVFVAGGYVKGGRAPGGEGLTPEYAINREVLLKFIPEFDDSPEPSEPPENGETMDETKDEILGETFQKKGETKGVHAHTSSLSSSPSPVPTMHWAASAEGGESDRCNGGNGKPNLVVVGGETPSQSPTAGTRCVHTGAPGVSSVSSTSSAGKAPASAVSSSEESPVAPEVGGEDNANPVGSGRESQDNIQFENLEDRAEQIIASARQRQLEHKMSDAEIYREYKAVYDRLRREHRARNDFEPKFFRDPNDPRAAGLLFTGGTQRYAVNPVWEAMPKGKSFENDLRANAEHRHDAAELYRAIGRDAALSQWEEFLVNEEHDTTQRVEYEPGKFATEEVERSWLLHDFVVAHGVSASEPAPPMLEPPPEEAQS